MSQQSYEIISRPRHLRYIFLVEIGYEGSKMIALMQRLMDFWGGRLSPIIPVNTNAITDQWKTIIASYDPDYVCQTNKVSEEFALFICTELRLNPIEIINVDEKLHEIKGVSSQSLIPVINNYGIRQTFLQSRSLWQIKNPLIDYFKFNYLLSDSYVINTSSLNSHEIAVISPEEFPEINKIISEKQIYNNTNLSSINANTTLLRPSKYRFLFFELVIVSNYDSFDDLIYHWNKRLYAPRNFIFSSLLITLEQLDLLLKDPNFGVVLDSLPGEYNQINLVSFSISEEELQKIASQFTGITKRNRFEVSKSFCFPFELQDAQAPFISDIKERSTVQVIPSSRHLIYQTSLSFNKSLQNTNQKWCIDININEIGGMSKQKRFPLNTQAQYITRGRVSRIDKTRQLVVLNGIDDGDATWTIDILAFKDNITQVIRVPRLINEPDHNLYSHCSFNDSGNRLKQFVKLFDDNFSFIEEFIYDKFWSDIFHELTNNVKVEGDTITFNEIIEKCIAVFTVVGGLKPRSESIKNEDNLRKGIRITLQRLVDAKIFLPGFVMKCSTCSSKIWYSLKETDNLFICKGCSNQNHFQSELPISYKLNHLIKNNIGMRSEKGVFVPDGNLTAIKTLLHLNGKSYNSFEYIPQIDIYRNYEDEKPITDLDIICLVNGELYIGECKYSSPLFFDNNKKSLDNLIYIASTVRPDYIILSCTEDKYGKLEKARQYIEHFVRRWEGKPKVIGYINREPDYFELSGGHNYFLH